MIDWKNVTTALFDMDGTIIDLRFDTVFWTEHLPKKFSEHTGIDVEAAKAKLTAYSSSIYGTLPWYCIDAWSETLGMDVASFKSELSHLIQFRPNAELLLKSLQENGIKTRLITNAHPASLALKMSVCPLADYFDDILSAHDIGHAKESAEFWRILGQLHPFDPQKTVFFDDNEAVLSQAKAQKIKYLFSIEQPDSAHAIPVTDAFPSVRCFSELLPEPD